MFCVYWLLDSFEANMSQNADQKIWLVQRWIKRSLFLLEYGILKVELDFPNGLKFATKSKNTTETTESDMMVLRTFFFQNVWILLMCFYIDASVEMIVETIKIKF